MDSVVSQLCLRSESNIDLNIYNLIQADWKIFDIVADI